MELRMEVGDHPTVVMEDNDEWDDELYVCKACDEYFISTDHLATEPCRG